MNASGKKIAALGEFGLIKRITRRAIVRPERVVKGIGDDAAVFHPPQDQPMLLTTDLLVEQIHFRREAISGKRLGFKSLAVNLSDIAAMGGAPLDAFVSIAIPADCPLAYIDAVYAGLRELADQFGVNILGGDTTGSKKDLIINIAVTGTVDPDHLLLRDGARPGDLVYVTGFVGDSRAGLQVILEELELSDTALVKLYDRHCKPLPHIEEGRFLARSTAVTAAIDVSDGVASDLGHIISRSGCGAVLDTRQLPISSELKQFGERFSVNAVDFALNGGEDYVLLCTVKAEMAAGLEAAFLSRFGHSLYKIGAITSSGYLEAVDVTGQRRAISFKGWDHFRKGN